MSRKGWRRFFAVLLAGASALAASGNAADTEKKVLDGEKGHWRVFTCDRTPELASEEGTLLPLLEHPNLAKDPNALKPVPVTGSPMPPKEWTATDFNDSGWALRKTPCESEYTEGYPNDGTRGALYGKHTFGIFLRGNLDVEDPAGCKDLQLVLEYHGGVVVYVNGKEVKRQDMPDGELSANAVAVSYPKAGAYVKAQFEGLESFRTRKMLLDLPQKLWSKGANVVAIEVRRAPFHEAFVKEIMEKPETAFWPHIQVLKAVLRSGWGMSATEKMKVKLDRSVGPTDVNVAANNVLNTATSRWRSYVVWKTPELIDKDGQPQPLRERFNRYRHKTSQDCEPFPVYATPSPPAGWQKTEFDDSAWVSRQGGFAAYGGDTWMPNNADEVQRIYCRGRFEVKDTEAAKDLVLYLEFHGGATACVNGQELARARLPAGDLTDQTPAEPYGKDAYFRPDGKPVNRGDWQAYAGYLRENRVRALQADVPPGLLRKGVNVLAIEVRRPLMLDAAVVAEPWPQAALLSATLCTRSPETLAGAVGPNLAPPEAVQCWTRDATASKLNVDEYVNGCETAAPMRIVGARNGAFSAMAVLGCDEPIVEPRAVMSDLRAGAAVIPASSAEIFYPRPDNPPAYDSLVPDPPDTTPVDPRTKTAKVPVWVKLHVPLDAKPGDYTGQLTIAFKKGVAGINVIDEKPIKIPVLLKVYDFALPRPQDSRTFVDMIQSPETVAIQYKVALWSDEHFKYLEKSLKLLGECANKTTYIRTMNKNHFGDSQTIIRFVKGADGKYSRDYSILDRYLDLVEKYQGKPLVVVIYAWERYVGGGMAPLVTEFDPNAKTVKEIETPKYCTPEGVAFWKPFFDELRERLGKRGLDKALMIGAGGDFTGPSKAGVEFFKEVAPGLPWVSQGHGGAGSFYGVPVGYCTTVWNASGPSDPRTGQHRYGWKNPGFYCQFDRDLFISAPMPSYRQKLEWNLMGGQRGIGRMGGDFWDVLKPGEKIVTDSRHSAGATLVNRYGNMGTWGQLVVRTRMINAGKDGAIPSARYEALREGLQDCEARISLEATLLDPAKKAQLGEDLAKRALQVLDHRQWMMAGAQCWNEWFVTQDYFERQNALYGLAAEFAAKLGAR